MTVATAVGVWGLHAYPFPREHVFLEFIALQNPPVFQVVAHVYMPEQRPTPMLVLGEAHFASVPGRAPEPAWLTIRQRGLCTGVMIRGAVGTEKTSACMYPYVDQLLRWRADDPDRKIGAGPGKGDFCHQVRSMLARAGRQAAMFSPC